MHKRTCRIPSRSYGNSSAGGLALWQSWRVLAVGAAGGEEHGAPGRERRGRAANRDRAGDRGVAAVRANRRIRAADAPGAPRRAVGGFPRTVSYVSGRPRLTMNSTAAFIFIGMTILPG
jgi:hypothetical protein